MDERLGNIPKINQRLGEFGPIKPKEKLTSFKDVPWDHAKTIILLASTLSTYVLIPKLVRT